MNKTVLPSKFLLGGNIRDPLNLNSLADERISKIVNAITPESSPLPTPKHRKAEYKIEVLIPPNITDPLNLNSGVDENEYAAKLASNNPVVRRKKFRYGIRDESKTIYYVCLWLNIGRSFLLGLIPSAFEASNMNKFPIVVNFVAFSL